MKILIGIISYFPNIERIRKHRIRQLQYLIQQCNTLFNFPIYIVAQNWGEDCNIQDNNLKVFYHEKLGIVGARKRLREYFLNSDYDYMITLDDDCILSGSNLDVKMFLHDIQNHRDGCVFIDGAVSAKLVGVSKFIMREVDYWDLSPEKNEGHEDFIWANNILYNYSKYVCLSKTHLRDLSDSVVDPFSTWRNEYKDTIDRDLCMKNTQEIIKKLRSNKND